MKNLLILLSIVFAAGLVQARETSYWLANGTGNWASETRWVDGKVPQEGYSVRSSTGDILITDADAEIVSRVWEVVQNDKTKLCSTTRMSLSLCRAATARSRRSEAVISLSIIIVRSLISVRGCSWKTAKSFCGTVWIRV